MKEKIRKLFSNVWTIPNVLTMLRMALIPVFVVFFCKAHAADPVDNTWLKASLAVFVAASLTDMLDGYLARRLNQITDFGKLFDPLADKLMVLTAMVCQTVAGVFPLVAVIIVAVKELVMVLGGIFMLSKNVVVYSNYVGKAAQVFFILSLILSFFHEELEKGKVIISGRPLDVALLWATVALCLAALIVYASETVKKLKAKSAAPETPEGPSGNA